MAFYSSYVYVRAAPPPVVTLASIASFVQKAAASGAISDSGKPSISLKFGPTVDADESMTGIETRIKDYISQWDEIEWDETVEFNALQDLTSRYAGDLRTVYRASITLGYTSEIVRNVLSRQDSPENDIDLNIFDISFSIEPIICGCLEYSEDVFVGWMALTLHGYGYFYPWDYREVRRRAESCEPVRKLMAACESIWPVAAAPVNRRVITARKKIKKMWLYDDLDRPQSWYWSVRETG